jgi:tRNA nucleotidyltransferase (CCA-adding enzyme)
MKVTGALTLFPEILALLNVNQDPEYHPEGQDHPDGSLWVHTLMVVDEAAKIVRREGLEEEKALIVMLAALCHDFGKPATTEFVDGRWRARGHEEEGEFPTRSFLQRMKAPHALEEAVVALVVDHLKPSMFHKQRSGAPAVRRLAHRLAQKGTDVPTLCLVAEADANGRTTPRVLNGEPYESGPWLISKLVEFTVQKEGPKPILMGRHLIAMGVKPGPDMGRILSEGFAAQLDGEFSDEEGALEWMKKR